MQGMLICLTLLHAGHVHMLDTILLINTIIPSSLGRRLKEQATNCWADFQCRESQSLEKSTLLAEC